MSQSLIAVIISDEEARKNIVKILSKNPSNVITSQPFVPDILSFLKSGGYNVAIVDGEYLEKIQDAEIVKSSIPTFTNIIAWVNKYDAQRAVSLISQGALDVLCPPVNPAEIISVIGYHLGGFYLKRKSDFSMAAKFLRNIRPLHWILSAVFAAVVAGFFLFQKFTPFYSVKSGTYTLLDVQSPTGVWMEGGKIYVSDWLTQTIFGFKLDSGSFSGRVFESYYLAECNPLFVSKCEDIIFTAASSGGAVAGNSGTFYKYSLKKDAAILVEKFPSPGPAPSGFTTCAIKKSNTGGQFAYSVDSHTRKIYQHLPSAGYPVVNSYDFAGISPVGIVYDGKYFYIADSRGGRIYKYIGPANNFVPVAAYNVRLQESDKEISGFYKDNKNIYILCAGGADAARGSQLYVIKF